MCETVCGSHHVTLVGRGHRFIIRPCTSAHQSKGTFGRPRILTTVGVARCFAPSVLILAHLNRRDSTANPRPSLDYTASRPIYCSHIKILDLVGASQHKGSFRTRELWGHDLRNTRGYALESRSIQFPSGPVALSKS